jgi:TRAP transporter TAXI family solute receptor
MCSQFLQHDNSKENPNGGEAVSVIHRIIPKPGNLAGRVVIAQGIYGFLLLFVLAGFCSGSQRIRIASGKEGGVYEALAEGLKMHIDGMAGYRAEIIKTDGAKENALKLSRKEAEIGFVSNDIAYYAYEGIEMFSKRHMSLRGVVSLYSEVIHVVVKESSGFEGIADLSSQPVSVGPEDSGTRYNAKQILEAYYIYENTKSKFEDMAFVESLEALRRGDIEAAFITAGVPTPAIQDVFKENGLAFLSLDDAHINKLKEEYQYYLTGGIPADAYGRPSNVKTVAVKALLVTNADVEDRLISELTSAIACGETAEVFEKSPVAFDIGPEPALKGMSIPLHPAARRFFESRDLLHTISNPIIWLSIPGLFLGTVILFPQLCRKCAKWRGIGTVARSLTRHKNARLLAVFPVSLCMILLSTEFIHLSESRYAMRRPGIAAQPFSNLWDAFTWTYFGSKSSDDFPRSTGGKFAAATLALLGRFGILAVAANYIVDRLGKGKDMPGNWRGHIVICNWNSRGKRLIEQLQHKLAGHNNRMVAITRSESEKNREELIAREEGTKRIDFIAQDDREWVDVLREARVQLSESVIILTDKRLKDPDAKTTWILEAVKRLKQGKDKPHVIAEAYNMRHVEDLRMAGADECVCSDNYDVGLMAQCAIHPNVGLSVVYRDLLRFSDDTNELYTIKVEDHHELAKRSSFEELSAAIASWERFKHPVILLGVIRGKKVEGPRPQSDVLVNPKSGEFNPKERTFDRFQTGDILLTLAYRPPNLERLLTGNEDEGRPGITEEVNDLGTVGSRLS